MTAPGLRLETAEDAEFLRRLFAADASALLHGSGLPEAMVADLVDAQIRSRDRTYRDCYPTARYGIVTCADVPVGRLVVADMGDLAHVVDIAILPSRRREGLAAALMRDAMAPWAAQGRGGRADVYVGNAASLALFIGLGFAGRPEPGNAQVRLTWWP
ncbi:MAG: GNAT family N-acetyltransferase [Methylobacterium sp.]